MKIIFHFILVQFVWAVLPLQAMDFPRQKQGIAGSGPRALEKECREQLSNCTSALEEKEILWAESGVGTCYPKLKRCLDLLKPKESEYPALYALWMQYEKSVKNTMTNSKRKNPKEKLVDYFDQYTLDMLTSEDILNLSGMLYVINFTLKQYQQKKQPALECVSYINETLNSILELVREALAKKGQTEAAHVYFQLIPKIIEPYLQITAREFGLSYDSEKSSPLKEAISAFACSSEHIDKGIYRFCTSIMPTLNQLCDADELMWLGWKLAEYIDEKNGNIQERLMLLYMIQQNAQVYCGTGKQVKFFLNAYIGLLQQALSLKEKG